MHQNNEQQRLHLKKAMHFCKKILSIFSSLCESGHNMSQYRICRNDVFTNGQLLNNIRHELNKALKLRIIMWKTISSNQTPYYVECGYRKEFLHVDYRVFGICYKFVHPWHETHQFLFNYRFLTVELSKTKVSKSSDWEAAELFPWFPVCKKYAWNIENWADGKNVWDP